MSELESLKYQKLLWSFVIIGAVTLFFVWRLHPSHSDLGYGFDLWVLFMIAVWITIIASPIVLLLRLLRIIKNRESFGYILTASVNLCVGTYGLWQLAGSHMKNDFYILVHLGNLLLSLFIFTDTFIKKLPGIRRI